MTESFLAAQPLANAVIRRARRATLPFQQAHSGKEPGTAFWYNDLVEATAGEDFVRPYLVTAAGLTGHDLAEWTLRPELCEPEMSAELLLMPAFAEQWTALPGLGVAVLPAAGLRAHAARKGWRWSTDEITEGFAATSADLALITGGPAPALVLGHDVGANGERAQLAAVGEAVRDTDGTLRWRGRLPDGCAGSPVFVGLPRDDDSWRLKCLGPVLPGAGANVIAPFDRIRAAVRALPN